MKILVSRVINSSRHRKCGVHSYMPAFSKRFVGAGHFEEGGGPGGEGTLPSACKACTFRGF